MKTAAMPKARILKEAVSGPAVETPLRAERGQRGALAQDDALPHAKTIAAGLGGAAAIWAVILVLLALN